MADGSLDDSEGDFLKEWITKTISPFSDEKREELKELYNKSMVEAYKAAENDNLTLSDLTHKLNEIAEKSTRYETIELCYDVMAADGVIDPNEIQIIRKIAEALELDFDEIEKIRDTRMIGLDINLSQQSTIEEMLDIDPEWDVDRIKKHLRTEFQKWNNRLNTLEEGDERDNAQRMLELVADARKIEKLSFSEANELAYFGANILHAKTIIPLLEKNIPLRILNTFDEGNNGTLITSEASEKGIKSLREKCRILFKH